MICFQLELNQKDVNFQLYWISWLLSANAEVPAVEEGLREESDASDTYPPVCTQRPSPSSTFIPSAWSISVATFPVVVCVPWFLKLPFTFHGVFSSLFFLTSVPVCEVVVGPKACRVLVPSTELQCGLNVASGTVDARNGLAWTLSL